MTGTLEQADDILLVEDNPDDVDLTREAFREVGAVSRLHVVENGIEAIAFLRHEAKYADAPTPDLVLLDLNLPKRSGHEVLAAIKRDPALRGIPVVVLTSSAAESDMARSRALGADGYVTKPVDLDDYLRVVHTIDALWRASASGRRSPPQP
jgi:two-component system, chemotaxis family, response regulator Rcp1